MAETRIAQATSSNLTTAIQDYVVNQQTTDSVEGQEETRYYFTNFSKWYGYYRNIPSLKATIDAKARWTVGRGYQADEVTTMILDQIKGHGKDTFNSILENMHRVMQFNGDAFAEIITNEDGVLKNLKPIDPSTMCIVSNRKGIIKRYEQLGKTKDKIKVIATFQPHEILHFSRNRTADEIHGLPFAEGMEFLIESFQESMHDWRKVLHRNIAPMMKWIVDTDDPTEIANFKSLVDTARSDFENIVIPKGTVEHEVISIAPNQTMNPMPWLDALNNYIYQASGIPDVIIGGTQSLTEASAKIKYLAFQQNVEEDQLYIEEQFLSQCNLRINLNFPASLENEALSAKDNGISVNQPQIQGGETAVEGNDQQMNMAGKK